MASSRWPPSRGRHRTANLSYARQVDLWTHATRIAADRVLNELGLARTFTIVDRTTSWTYEIPAITAFQYAVVIDALCGRHRTANNAPTTETRR